MFVDEMATTFRLEKTSLRIDATNIYLSGGTLSLHLLGH